MGIFHAVLNSIQTRATGIPRLQTCRVAGRTLQVRTGTYRARPDYDDAWLLACALRATTVLDIGSNIGQAALIIGLSPSVKRLVLVDPNPNAVVIAADNLLRNRPDCPVSIICAFASDVPASGQTFWTVGFGAAGSCYPSHAKTAFRKGRSISVMTTTVDDIITRLSLAPDFIKIDVEGAESKVLDGAQAWAKEMCTRFLVEMHASQELPMTQNAAQVLAWCHSHQYAAWYLAKHERLVKEEQIAQRGRCHLLLQPAHWKYPPWLLPLRQSDSLEKAFQTVGEDA